MSAPEDGVIVPAGRGADGKFGKGNKIGLAGGWRDDENRVSLRIIARLAQERSRRAIDRLTEIMESDDEKCAVAACSAILKVAGAFDMQSDEKTEEMAKAYVEQRIAEARAKREANGG